MSSRSRSRWANKRKPSSTIFDDDEFDEGEEAEAEEEEFHRTPSNKRQRTLPRAIRDRIDRALNQRLYLLTSDSSIDRSSLHRKYQVLGQTANVYTVEISRLPSCTCPDHANGFLCKHIIFVLHRVLKVSRQSPFLYQHSLTTEELAAIFIHADGQQTDQSVLAEPAIRQAFEEENSPPKTKKKIEQKPISTGDECPICFEAMVGEAKTVLFCSRSCGNNMHRSCFDKWQCAKKVIGEKVTCPFCRVEWKDDKDKDKEEEETNSDGYRNLAAYATTDEYDYDDDIVYRRRPRRRRDRDFYW